MTKESSIVDVTDCSNCPFFADDDRNGPHCGAPTPWPLPSLRWNWRKSPSTIVITRPGPPCPLTRVDVIVHLVRGAT